ncbi:hypothetical protein GUJ93_ZPchr0002g25903 [Zizania palustris]|uniref:Uncharacterized protein n=1 Tax=Zizania palustris TaxID=103762 RepID=A0A8J5VCN2_ZIZPA|nr:hypothetical protein GUJ93_ZPchr0002g25903 [Zizania palustris]
MAAYDDVSTVFARGRPGQVFARLEGIESGKWLAGARSREAVSQLCDVADNESLQMNSTQCFAGRTTGLLA